MLFRKSTSDLFLMCDIGSGSVALALVDAGETPAKVLLTTRQLAVFANAPTYIAKQALLIKTLDTLGKQFQASIRPILEKKKVRHMHDAHIVFSSPWYLSKTTVQSIHKETEFILDSRSLGQVIEDEEKKFEAEVSHSSNTRFSKRDIHMIEREIMRVLLNGYETDNPYFKKVKQVDFCLYMSIVPHDFLFGVDASLRSHFHVHTVQAHSFPLVCYESVAVMFPHETDLILIDAGGETTDVTIVRNNAIEASESFPYGRNEALKSIAKGLSVPCDVAASYLQMMHDGTLEKDIETSVQTQIDRVSSFWLERFQEVRGVIPDGKILKRIFLTAKDDFAPILTKALTEQAKCQVFSVNDELMKGHILYADMANDPSVLLGALMIAKRRKKQKR
jgi:hypothetical protein